MDRGLLEVMKRGMQHLADGVLVINLDERPDRWQDFERDLAQYFHGGSLERLSAIKGTALQGYGKPPLFRGRNRDTTWAGRAGCTLSHRKAIAHAAQAGWDSVLILEDDIQVEPAFLDVCNALVDALSLHQWDVCYLGFTDPVGPFRKLADLTEGYSLYQLYGCNATHACLIRNTAYDRLLTLLPDESDVWYWLTRYRAIDRWYSRTLSRYFRVLAVSPSVINQKQGVSDITGRRYEHAHVMAIPGNSSQMLPYSLMAAMRRMKFFLLDFYDALRGIIKRKKGF